MRGEEPDRVVSPVVAESQPTEMCLRDELVDGQQLHRGDAELLQVVGHHGVAQRCVGAPELLGDPVVQLGEALDVQLVDDGVAPPSLHRSLAAPVEVVVDHDRLAGVRRGVAVVADIALVLARVGPHVPEERRLGAELARHCARIRVEQQLARVEPQAPCPAPRARRHGTRRAGPGGSRAARRARCRGCARSARAGPRGRPRRTGTPRGRWRRGSRRRSWWTPRSRSRPAASCVRAIRRSARRSTTTSQESPGRLLPDGEMRRGVTGRGSRSRVRRSLPCGPAHGRSRSRAGTPSRLPAG